MVQSSYSESEGKVREMWTDILACGDVTIDDNFLDLGGDSLSASLFISRVRRMFGVEFSVGDLLTDKVTLRQLAAMIDREKIDSTGREDKSCA